MPKQKTHKGLAKRVKVTASGKIKARKSFAGHLMSCKNAKKRRNLRQSMTLSSSVTGRIKALLGKG
ncbi:MAG: 50S ribosomal protein L35 [Anaerohalosphaeraceae bacterium]|nr:50S ribosomal protein L35 [Anaerohalosphaeraceae bacterium]